MQKLVLIAEDVVLLGKADGQVESCDLPTARALLAKSKKAILVGVVPCQTAMLMGSEQTVDQSAGEHFPKNHSLRTESLGANSYQVFALADDLFEGLRKLGKKVDIVPYAVAVRSAVEKRGERTKTGARRLTQVLTGESVPQTHLEAPGAAEFLVVEALQGGCLVTALRGKEIVAVRHVLGGNTVDEIQRTLAAARLTSPRIFCADRDLAVELQAHGFQADAVTTEVGLLGWAALESALPLRFLNPKEIAQARMERSRTVALTFVAISSLITVLAIGAAFMGILGLTRMSSQTRALESKKAILTAQISKLYLERYPTKAHAESVRLDNEILDLALSLPPQVTMTSFEKTREQISAVLERQAGAAPFGRDDLKGLLMVSPFFANAEISEEFSGHAVRYQLRLKVPKTVFETSQVGAP